MGEMRLYALTRRRESLWVQSNELETKVMAAGYSTNLCSLWAPIGDLSHKNPAQLQAQESKLSPMQAGPFVVHSTVETTIRSRSLPHNDLKNIPLDQQQQQVHMEEDEWMQYIFHQIDSVDRDAFVRKKIIFSAPRAIFEVRPRSYCPRIVTIGPLCRKLARSPMDRWKALCVKEFTGRRGISLQELISRVFENVDNLKHIYFGIPNYDAETLKLLLTVDLVFIYELLFFISQDSDPNHSACGYMGSFSTNRTTETQVLRDFFLTGNQVPLSLLKRIVEIAEDELTESVLEMCLLYIVWRGNPFLKSQNSTNFISDLQEMLEGVSILDCEHFLECLYVTCVHKPDYNDKNIGEFTQPGSRLPSASQLRKVGIKFQACQGNTAVVRYQKHKLTFDLPKLSFYDETEDILRNLVAYELTSKAGGEFTGYAIIMDSLIDTQEDLAILYKAGILENHLGSDERLLRMWNEMCINISEGSCERWERMTCAIMTHYRSDWRIMYTEFHSTYFSRPWLWLSTIAAILLLGMSALQTIYSALSYY